MIRYGAKTIAAGGYFAMPRIYADGVLLVGDCAGFLNSQRLKGIHSAIKSGMLAAETIFRSAGGRRLFSQAAAALREAGERSWIIPELRKVRNFHAGFKHGRWLGIINTGFQFVTGGQVLGLFDRAKAEAGHEACRNFRLTAIAETISNNVTAGLNSTARLLSINSLTFITLQLATTKISLFICTCSIQTFAPRAVQKSMAIPVSGFVRQQFMKW